MSYDTNAAVPPDIVASLPPLDLLRQVLALHIIEIPVGYKLVRAAWNPPSVWPERVTKTYRYGPHDSLKDATSFPFHWIYAAEEVLTAAWEAQLCSNPAIYPGRFTVQFGAEKALIATLIFKRPLRLFDLSGIAASRLGIYDQLRSPDYEWCQWFGFVLDQILVEQGGQVHGFVYPSRRHPGAPAYAISSRVRQELVSDLTTVVKEFGETAEFKELLGDPCYLERSLL